MGDDDGPEGMVARNKGSLFGSQLQSEPTLIFGKEDGSVLYETNVTSDGWDGNQYGTLPENISRQRRSSYGSMEAEGSRSPRSQHFDDDNGSLNYIDTLDDPGTTSGFAGDA